MQYTKSGLQLTKTFEGCRFVAYQDQGGKWTIGYGHTLGVTPGMTCTLAQAERWLLQDIENAVITVNTLVTTPLNQDEFNALVDFVFNLGAWDFRNSTMLRLLNCGDLIAAANEFEKWDHIGAKEIAGLLKRRKAEETEFLLAQHQGVS